MDLNGNLLLYNAGGGILVRRRLCRCCALSCPLRQTTTNSICTLAYHGRKGLNKLRFKLHALKEGLKQLSQVVIVCRYLIRYTTKKPHKGFNNVGRGDVGMGHLQEQPTKDYPRLYQPGALLPWPQCIRSVCPSPQTELEIPGKHWCCHTVLCRGPTSLQHRKEVIGIERLKRALVYLQHHINIGRHFQALCAFLGWLGTVAALGCCNRLQGFQGANCVRASKRLPKLVEQRLRRAGGIGDGGSLRRHDRRLCLNCLIPVHHLLFRACIFRTLRGAGLHSGRCQTVLDMQSYAHDKTEDTRPDLSSRTQQHWL
mmetsp:Transcript_117899/g.328419  ORF Transcript_117899/g.328419 Transcript_117899/m.328419 type:complete len:313 (-) Transcript_117899:2561-3499(-)